MELHPPLVMNREVCPASILRLIDEDSPVDPPGLPIGAFPVLESLFPADGGDKEKARLIVRLLELGLDQDSGVEDLGSNSRQ
jgi:hypothetical protein